MKPFALAAAIALGAAAFAPLPSMAARTDVSLFVSTAPPAPIYEVVPAPRRGYVWAPGHWEWNGHRHIWSRGVWVVERPGYAYSAPVWYQSRGGWAMRPAAWTPYGPDRDRDGVPDRFERRYDGPRYGYDRPGYRDRDRDGVPDRYERPRSGRHDEDHDGIPNRYDRDRDGDGVPNRYDSRPDNGWRR
nr:YXWGXW repeat-containing protein [uncultured Massilia sp.]